MKMYEINSDGSKIMKRGPNDPYFQKWGPLIHTNSHCLLVMNNSNTQDFQRGTMPHNFQVCTAFFKNVREFRNTTL